MWAPKGSTMCVYQNVDAFSSSWQGRGFFVLCSGTRVVWRRSSQYFTCEKDELLKLYKQKFWKWICTWIWCYIKYSSV
jgi:hypothetical protein